MYVKLLADTKFRMEKPVDPIADYLRSWGLEMYIETFAAHAIDAETLQMLSEGDIKDLIPIIGHRAKLMAQVNILKNIMTDRSTEPVAVADINLSSQSYDIDELPILTDSTLLVIPPEALEREENIKTTCEVYKVLSSCNEGKGLLLRYQESGLLNSAARRQLCSIIISSELKENAEKRITSSRFYQLAYEINQVFRKESSAIYFTPFTSFSPLQKITAKGKLLDCYRHKRRSYLKSGVISAKNRRCSTASSSRSSEPESPRPSTSRQEAINLLENNDDDDVAEKMLWLKNCLDPWATVQLYWKITAKERLNLLAASSITIDQYFEEFKALNQPGGLFLILQDFKDLYPDIHNKLTENWHLIKNKIIEYTQERKDRVPDKIKDYIHENDEETTDLAAFMILFELRNRSFHLRNTFRKHLVREHDKYLNNSVFSDVAQRTNLVSCPLPLPPQTIESVGISSSSVLCSSLLNTNVAKNSQVRNNSNNDYTLQLFISSLYANPLIPRKVVQDIVVGMNKFCVG